MIALLQRVTRASVSVKGDTIAEIGPGLLVLIGAEQGDGEPQSVRLVERVLGYRVFGDDQGRMNLDVVKAGGEVLLVPQFTLAADTSSGRRPGFSTAAHPDQARILFEHCRDQAAQRLPGVQCGRFGADMQVELINDGPVTFWLQVRPEA